MIYAFGDCELDLQRYVVRVDGEVRSVEPQVFDVLTYLVKNRGRVVTKEELLDEVWGDRFVSESALTSRIKAARRAVGDDGTNQAVIRTAYGKGYEFIVPVVEIAPPDPDATSALVSSPIVADVPSVPTIAAQVPARTRQLIGRDLLLVELASQLAVTRLLTLVGPAGVGKTALAYELGRSVGDKYPDGTWVCELAAVADASTATEAIATALDVSTRLATSLEDSIIDRVRGRHALLVLDNCEHLVEPIGLFVERVLRAAPDVTVLATSREPLAVASERVCTVEPLVLDDAAGDGPSPAVELFVERAIAADNRFRLDDATSATIAEICRRLDGIPLAIELAAARTRAIGVDDIAARLDERFRLLKGVRRGTDPRHQALADAIRWSYDLLAADEQQLFGYLSVFAGPFDLDDAESVCEPEDGDLDVLDTLSRLADRSMVTVRRPHGGATRYEMLETLREYARERLPDRELVELSSRHARHYADLARDVDTARRGPRERALVERADAALADLRAAQRGAMRAGDLDNGLAIVTALGEYAMRTMRYEVFGWADQAFATPGSADHDLYPPVLGLRAYGAWIRGEFELAERLADEVTSIERVRGLPSCGLDQRVVGNVRFVVGDYAAGAAAMLRQFELAEESGDSARIVHAHYMRSIAASTRDLDDARRLATRARQLADATGSPTDLASAWAATGFSAGEIDAAIDAFERADRAARQAGNRWMSNFVRTESAGLLLQRGDLPAACAGFADVVDVWFRAGEWSQQWLTLGGCLVALAAIGADELAATVSGAVSARSTIGATPMNPSLRDRALETEDQLRDRLGDERYDECVRVGAAMADVEVVHRTRAALTAAT